MFDTWEDRVDFMSYVQKELIKKFGEDNYNVFFFGSFVTSAFKPGNSDIDIAVYCNDLITRIDILDALDSIIDPFIKKDVVTIDLNNKHAYVLIDPLKLRLGVTDYFPEELSIYMYTVERNYRWHVEDQLRYTRMKNYVLVNEES